MNDGNQKTYDPDWDDIEDTPERRRAMEKVRDKFLSAVRTADKRTKELKATYPDDVRRLYQVWANASGSSEIAGDVLLLAHRKRGLIEPTRLRCLDGDVISSALNIMEALCYPVISNRGLICDSDENPVLTEAQVRKLEAYEKRIEASNSDAADAKG